ncbi:MAG: hypothetical protein GXP26_01030 [Planctomycetes bacterium]|nr:hypothetical protein [Planctomycetota bacterium]
MMNSILASPLLAKYAGKKLVKVGWLSLLVAVATQAASCLAAADWKDDIGYTQLVSVLGNSTPNGAGVPISLVEAPTGGGAYFPDTYPVPTNPQFTAGSDPFSEDIIFTDGSGMAANGVSGHAASVVGSSFFGNSSPAAGANAVTVYEANDWIENVLNMDNGQDPETQNFRVQNFSWIGTFDSGSQDRNVLRRFDFMIDRDNVTAMVGLNNGSATPLPQLLVHSYNAIAVGRSDGIHSTGLTGAFYGPGRLKPEIVAPVVTTSQATGVLSSVATLLHEAVAGGDATNSEVMKAILLAGATKDEFVGWSRTTTQPLDDTYGAGQVNVYNSYLMTLGGQTAGSTDVTGATVETVDSSGWDYRTVNPSNDLFYNFEIPVGSTAPELSVILDWNVEVTDTNGDTPFSGSESLANLDLALYNSTTTFMESLVDAESLSISVVDNVEHIYQTDLGPGLYTLRVSGVSGASARDFGLAWRLNTLFDVPSADFDEDGDVDGMDFLAWQSNFGTLLGATRAMGDADGDGDVDEIDAAILDGSFGTVTPSVTSLANTVPEPATLAHAFGGMLLLLLSRRSRKPRCLC